MKSSEFLLGCEVLAGSAPSWLRTARLGLLSNQASVSRSLEHVRDMIAGAGGRLTCLFSPQHGFFSEKQANMIESEDSRDPELRIPVVSLYSESREPSGQALGLIDVLLVDLQDVGTRVYTYTTTMGLCMEAAARTGTKVVVLDRPNPIGGMEIEGNVLDPEFRSFVGRYRVPMRHGLTTGEFARYIESETGIGCDLEVVAMQGWRRSRFFDGLDLQWVFPSPNIPTWETALLYPGMVLLEGTNVSEGRGTTLPFQLFGAPWLNQARVLEYIDKHRLEGVAFRPVMFEPAFDKFKGQPCRGFQMHVTDRWKFKPYKTALALLQAFCGVHPEEFRWGEPPYEYEWEKLPIDILIGNSMIRLGVERGGDLDLLEAEWMGELNEYRERRDGSLLYPE
ncbi:MAG: DUF1343 domain-containing protein [Syntrophobacteraceae bacterium]